MNEVNDDMMTQGIKSLNFDAMSGRLLAGLYFVLLSTQALALGTPAETAITNRATLDFQVVTNTDGRQVEETDIEFQARVLTTLLDQPVTPPLQEAGPLPPSGA